MDKAAAPGIFAQVCRRLLARDAHPAKIELGFQQACGNGGIKHIQRVFPADLHKFEIVVVVAEVHTGGSDLFADIAYIRDRPFPPRSAGAILRHKVGNGDIAAAHGGIIAYDLADIGAHFGKRNVCARRFEPERNKIFAYLLRVLPVKPGEFHAVVAHFLYFAKRSFEIRFEIGANGIKLKCKFHFCAAFPCFIQIPAPTNRL